MLKHAGSLRILRCFFVMIFIAGLQNPSHANDFEIMQEEMITTQLKARGISDPRVLKAMQETKRHLFVPPDVSHLAYADTPLPIGWDQTISQPYMVASMTEILRLKPTDKVLEIGTGCGYQAAVLAQLVHEVYSIELLPELAQSAEARLKHLGYKNVHVRRGDGYQGWPENAPFDAIILTAAPEEIPQTLVEQLSENGRMILPVGNSGHQELILLTKTKAGLRKEKLFPVRFVPMVKESRI